MKRRCVHLSTSRVSSEAVRLRWRRAAASMSQKRRWREGATWQKTTTIRPTVPPLPNGHLRPLPNVRPSCRCRSRRRDCRQWRRSCHQRQLALRSRSHRRDNCPLCRCGLRDRYRCPYRRRPLCCLRRRAVCSCPLRRLLRRRALRSPTHHRLYCARHRQICHRPLRHSHSHPPRFRRPRPRPSVSPFGCASTRARSSSGSGRASRR